VLLTAFPCLIVDAALRNDLRTRARKLAYFAASLALIWTITATYHLGYQQYRDKGIGEPELGNTIISVPMLLTVNPLGSILDHSAMHVTAVVHEYNGTRIPPKTTSH